MGELCVPRWAGVEYVEYVVKKKDKIKSELGINFFQEGSGPCLFCGAVVCTPEEEEWMDKDSKKSRKLREQFLKKHNIEVTLPSTSFSSSVGTVN